jgi:hypothetical protein
MADLAESVATALNGSGSLVTAFGKAGWIWLDLAPAGTTLPYAVLHDTDMGIEYESNGGTLARSGFQISVFATTRGSARSLAGQIRTAITDTEPTLDDGECIHLRPTSFGVSMEDEPGPAGVDVWHAVTIFDAIIDNPI